MRRATQFLNELAARGRYHFTTAEACSALGVSLPAARAVLRRMKGRGEIADPHQCVSLLSAAEFLGAAHQRPQVFQVMVRKNRRPIQCGDVRVEFVARRDLERMPTITRNTPQGTVRISSPETTALELVGYADRCGGLDNVGSVVVDLVDLIDAAKLAHVARLCPLVWAQRLGYLLDLTDSAIEPSSEAAHPFCDKPDGASAVGIDCGPGT